MSLLFFCDSSGKVMTNLPQLSRWLNLIVAETRFSSSGTATLINKRYTAEGNRHANSASYSDSTSNLQRSETKKTLKVK